ncbi:hypothetical protein [Streptomyces muensis]|uniref:Uncharacterized protein n=1 Tax=Streptomyces muensis TaxID=1077944 RepID=A0A9X1PW66_STRM4|nr:hypothetical protein [Streptomyces muensis]MCF1592401.1 hypothetical protein [Streptomyces muensis]
MTKNKKTSNSLSGRAHDLAEKTGMSYTAALEALRRPRAERTDEAQGGFVLTPEVERFVDGEGHIGVEYDLREFLQERSAKKYECYECYEPGSTATDPTSVIFTVSVYDPDLNPATHVMMTNFAHAACKPSVIRWAVPVEIPQQPHRVSVEVPDDPEERIIHFGLTAAAHLAPADEPDGPPLPVLLITAEAEDYEPHPSLFHLLDFHLLEDGFAYEGTSDMGERGWSLRVEHNTGTVPPSWIAVRAATSAPDEETGHGHFFLAAVDLTDEWVTTARQRGKVLILAGPVGPHTQLRLDDEDQDDVLELLEDGLVRGGWCPIDAPKDGHVRPTGAVRAR